MGVNPNGLSVSCILDFFSEMHIHIIFQVSFAGEEFLGEQFPLTTKPEIIRDSGTSRPNDSLDVWRIGVVK